MSEAFETPAPVEGSAPPAGVVAEPTTETTAVAPHHDAPTEAAVSVPDPIPVPAPAPVEAVAAPEQTMAVESHPDATTETTTNPVVNNPVAEVAAPVAPNTTEHTAPVPDVEMKTEETEAPKPQAEEQQPPPPPPPPPPEVVATELPVVAAPATNRPSMNPEQVKAALGDYFVSPNAAPPSAPKDRDVIFGEGARGHQSNLLLEDLIALHRLIWEISHEAPPKDEEEVSGLTERLFQLMKKGKGRDLAGMKDVPRSFLVGSGRFMRLDDNSEWEELSDEEAKKAMRGVVLSKMLDGAASADPSTALKDLKQEFHDFLISQGAAQDGPVEPLPADVVLLQRTDSDADKSFNNQNGNKALFTLASQHVNSELTSPSKRLEAALSVFLSKNAITDEVKEEKPKPRFILCRTGDDGHKTYSLVKPVDAAEVTLLFVFEVWLEKELAAKRDSMGAAASDVISHDDPKPSTDPIETPTPHDVLFGRGGMTNSHPGNKRFRDVIALHRPDYIKAIKNDKPNVARRIVRAIRTATPPGRFLKKNSEDGYWYDVGNRIAAEKASQALREKSNAEKRQRSAQREAMRTKRDGSSDSGGPTKKSKVGDAGISIASPLLANQLNYVGAPTTATQNMVTDAAKGEIKGVKVDPNKDDLKTEGLPPNAVDKDGNILVTDWDILAGRGGLTNHHRGNKRFRDIVALHRPDYIRAPKVQKPSVARVIVRAIRNGDPPGRFLKKDEKTGKWYDIGDKKAAEKTSQALREKGHDKERTPGSHSAADATPPAFLLPAPLGTTVPPLPMHTVAVTDGSQAPVAFTGSEIKAETASQDPTQAAPEVPALEPKVEEHAEATAPVPAPPAAAPTEATPGTEVAHPGVAVAAAVEAAVPTESEEPASNVPAPTAVVEATNEALNTAVDAANSGAAADVIMTDAAAQAEGHEHVSQNQGEHEPQTVTV